MTGRLDPPAWYPDGHRAIWAATIERLTGSGGVFRADPLVLDTYVCAHVNHTKAARIAAETAPVLIRNGHAVPNPALAEQRKAAADLARASRALGLDRNPIRAALAASPMRDDGRRWCDEHSRWECKHPRKDGKPCHGHPPMDGTGSCRMHVGMTAAQARAKGEEFRARLYTSDAVDMDPAEALLWEIGHSAAHVADLRAEVRALAAEPGPDGQPGSGLFYGTYRELWRDGELAERELRPGIHPKLRAYDAERDHLVKTAAAARTTGALEAQVNVARALGAGVHALLTAIFTDLELAQWQWDRVPQVVPARLAEFDPATRELEA